MDVRKILMAHYKKIEKVDNKYFKCAINPENIKEWYVLIHNLDKPYKNGEYVFKLVMKDSFPDTAPSMRALTPNGVFKADGGPICTSIGEFHERSFDKTGSYGYRTALGMYGFIMNAIVNAMLTTDEGEHGIRFFVQGKEERQKLAEESKTYNDLFLTDILGLFCLRI